MQSSSIHRRRAATVAAVTLLLALPAFAQMEGADQEARKARILDNLKLQFPTLADMDVTVEDLEPSGIEGLDSGSFTVRGRSQAFLVTADNTKLYLVAAGPIDVSLSPEAVAAERAKQAEEAAHKAEETHKELLASTVGDPVRGNPDAPVTIVEFSDFQCPYCARAAGVIEQVLEKHPDDVRLVYQHFPLGMHPWAKPAAVAAYCAAQQDGGAFWKLHDAYFANQRAITPENVVDKSREFLADTGIDLDRWAVCAADESSQQHQDAAKAVDADFQSGQQHGVSGTPGFFINGQYLSGAQPLQAFEQAIQEAKGTKAQGSAG